MSACPLLLSPDPTWAGRALVSPKWGHPQHSGPGVSWVTPSPQQLTRPAQASLISCPLPRPTFGGCGRPLPPTHLPAHPSAGDCGTHEYLTWGAAYPSLNRENCTVRFSFLFNIFAPRLRLVAVFGRQGLLSSVRGPRGSVSLGWRPAAPSTSRRIEGCPRSVGPLFGAGSGPQRSVARQGSPQGSPTDGHPGSCDLCEHQRGPRGHGAVGSQVAGQLRRSCTPGRLTREHGVSPRASPPAGGASQASWTRGSLEAPVLPGVLSQAVWLTAPFPRSSEEKGRSLRRRACASPSPPFSQREEDPLSPSSPPRKSRGSGSLKMLRAQALIRNPLLFVFFFFFKLIHFAQNSKTTKTCPLFAGSKPGGWPSGQGETRSPEPPFSLLGRPRFPVARPSSRPRRVSRWCPLSAVPPCPASVSAPQPQKRVLSRSPRERIDCTHL
ncbi:uncharacterized protein LOC125090322 [Lutra lutra]|uniref:uncharacterized protein LOC125090322 n=1 Tax=Lutra lutra TaxID=9657 RepID=UPI001FD557D4|nr:uncharacterized protein LOC125090322 [Lutra lutra]